MKTAPTNRPSFSLISSLSPLNVTDFTKASEIILTPSRKKNKGRPIMNSKNDQKKMKICQVRNNTVTKKNGHQPFLTFSVVQLLRYSGRTFPMLPFSGNICITSRPDSLAEVNRER